MKKLLLGFVLAFSLTSTVYAQDAGGDNANRPSAAQAQAESINVDGQDIVNSASNTANAVGNTGAAVLDGTGQLIGNTIGGIVGQPAGTTSATPAASGGFVQDLGNGISAIGSSVTNGISNAFGSLFGGQTQIGGGVGVNSNGDIVGGAAINVVGAPAQSQASSILVNNNFESRYNAIQGTGGSASVIPSGQFALPAPSKFNTIGQNISLRQYILNVLNFVLTFLGLIAVLFVIYAGFLYIMSAGDDGNIEKAKKIVIYAVIGILLILAAFAIVNTVIQNAGRGLDDRNNGGTYIVPGGTPISSGVLTDGGIVTDDGTVIPVNGPGRGNPTGGGFNGGSIAGSLQNLITASGAGVQDFGNTAVVDPDSARNGVSFGLATQGIALFDFGDGTQEILNTVDNPQATISHPFGEERTYDIRVILETAQGQQPLRKDLVVGGVRANFSIDKNQAGVNEPVALDAGATQVSVGSVRAYEWACSGGSGCFNNAFGRNTNVVFSAPGTYTVTLTVESVLGLSDSVEKTIQVVGGAPEANFSVQSAGNPNRPGEFTFNAQGSINRAGNPQGLTYFWGFDGDFTQSGAPTINYTFDSVGSKTVELVVTENFRGQTLRSEVFSENVNVETVLPVDFIVE